MMCNAGWADTAPSSISTDNIAGFMYKKKVGNKLLKNKLRLNMWSYLHFLIPIDHNQMRNKLI